MVIAISEAGTAEALGVIPGVALGLFMLYGLMRFVTKGGTTRKDIP
jgi:hypothetical protein